MDDIKAYIREIAAEAPTAWRRGSVAMTIILNAFLLSALFFGVQFTHYPTTAFLIGTAVIVALELLIIFPFKLWKANKSEIANLKGQLMPSIDLVKVIKHVNEQRQHTERLFDLELQNGLRPLEHCLVKIVSIKVREGMVADRHHLPLALRTLPRGIEGPGRGPFVMRAGEPKAIPFCSKLDGDRDIVINYEEGARTLKATDCEVELAVYSELPPIKRTAHLRVKSGKLSVALIPASN